MTLANGTTSLQDAQPTSSLAPKLEAVADRATTKAHGMIDRARDSTGHALDALSGGVDTVGHRAPEVINRVAAQVEELARRGIERARDTSAQVREQVGIAGDRTVARIQDQPIKAVLIAAAVGALLTIFLSGRRTRV